MLRFLERTSCWRWCLFFPVELLWILAVRSWSRLFICLRAYVEQHQQTSIQIKWANERKIYKAISEINEHIRMCCAIQFVIYTRNIKWNQIKSNPRLGLSIGFIHLIKWCVCIHIKYPSIQYSGSIILNGHNKNVYEINVKLCSRARVRHHFSSQSNAECLTI